jgi:predicted ATPase with chaperone activity
MGEISGPLLDRIDLHIEVPAVAHTELRGKEAGDTSAQPRLKRAVISRLGSTAALCPTARRAEQKRHHRGKVQGTSHWRSGFGAGGVVDPFWV